MSYPAERGFHLAVGVHWPELDEDLSIEGMLTRRMAPGPKAPELG